MFHKDYNYISYDFMSLDPKLVAKAKELEELYRTDTQPQRRNKKPYGHAFNVILTAMEIGDVYDGELIYISLDKNIFTGQARRSSTHKPESYRALNWLISKGYLDIVHGVKRTKPKPGEPSGFTPSAYKLSGKWLSEVSTEPLSSPESIVRNTDADYVELRKKVRVKNQEDPQSRLVKPTEEQLEKHRGMIEASERLLRQYDELMRSVVISLGDEPLSPAKTSMTRIFSKASYELGGRLYCPIQNLKKKQRPYLRFNGDPTIELDYGSLHPHMLYHREGLEFPEEDPYEIEGFDRDTVKKAFNTMLNRGGKGVSKSAANSLSESLKIPVKRAKELEKAIQEIHSPIKHYFNTGVGLKLQRLDSDLAIKIIDTFINHWNRPIIGVHDSFICSVRDVGKLWGLMFQAYDELFNSEESWEKAMSEAGDAESLKGVVGARVIKPTSLDFSDELSEAITRNALNEDDGMDDAFWNNLLTNDAKYLKLQNL